MMMQNKRGFQLSINMFVVLLLSIVILGLGFSLFAQGSKSIIEITEKVDAQTEDSLNRLLDDGSILVLSFREKTVSRGETAIFYLGISNELGDEYNFATVVTYGGSSAYPDPALDPHKPITFNQFLNGAEICDDLDDVKCGTNWVQVPGRSNKIPNNARKSVPIGISIPRKDVAKGQYVFNVDVCYAPAGTVVKCTNSAGSISNRYGTRLKLYVTVE